MATLLEGTGGHATHAPLSYEQTVSMGKHLQEQIDALKSGFDALRVDRDGANGLLGDLGKSLAKHLARQHKLEEDLVETNSLVDSQKKELAYTNGTIGKMQQEFANASDIIFALRKGHKVIRMDLQKVNQDLADNSTVTQAIKEALEKKVLAELQRHDTDLKQADLNLGRLQHDAQLMKGNIQTNKDDLRAAEETLQLAREDIVKLSREVCALDTRSGETLKTLKDTRQSLDELVAVCAKVSDDHDSTKSNVADLQLTSMKLGTHTRQLQEGLNRTATSLQGTQTQLSNTAAVLDATRENLEQTKGDLLHVKTNHEDLAVKHKSVVRATEELQHVTTETRKSLKDTNALVLPNLQMSGAQSVVSPSASLRNPLSPRQPLSPLATPGRGRASQKFS
uniref:Uncharacterized protein n=1 Tax=Noctiluca scintillans TaxID=2966 RepID=A0A7S0ZX87_NOCSC